jgi:2-methylcitrate dehydratase PrpD
MPALATLADFAVRLDPAALPAGVAAKAKTCLIDAIWGALQIHDDPRAKAALKTVPLDFAEATAPVLTSGRRAAPADAAFVSALAAAATDRSDTHVATATHPGIVVIPAVLAALCGRGGSGLDLLRGIVVGYEAMARIARAVHSPALAGIFRPTAVSAPVAAALGVAAALRLDRDAIVAAGSLAAQTAIGFNEWARVGTGEHVVHAGTAARNAVACALLAAEGFEAAPTALDGVSGLLAGYGALERSSELTRGLGERFEILDIVFKPAPACFFAQTPAQVAATAAAQLPRGAIVESVEIRVTTAAATYPGCAEADPIATAQAAVMSIPFAVAATLLAGRVDPNAWCDFQDLVVAALARRCRVIGDADLSAAYPARCGTSLHIALEGGDSLDVAQDDFQSMDAGAVRGRFRADGGPRIGGVAVERTLAAIEALESLPEAVALADLCAPASAPRKRTA